MECASKAMHRPMLRAGGRGGLLASGNGDWAAHGLSCDRRVLGNELRDFATTSVPTLDALSIDDRMVPIDTFTILIGLVSD